MRHRGRGAAAILAAALLTAAIAGSAAGERRLPATTSASNDRSAAITAPATTITLITGDRVSLDAEGTVVSVQPAKGREDVPISVHTADDQVLVLPADATAMVVDGTLDERLFDVTYLVESEYDDAGRIDLPVIVIGPGDGSRAHAVARGADGASVSTTLASVDGTAVEVDRAAGSAFWDSITRRPVRTDAPRVLTSGVEKIWLDGRVKATLDHSVQQVGSPAAWDSGLNGDGVTVAVLDTGIDDTHPDLNGQVDAAKNFSESKDAVDRVGHGTHVASTVAGSGAASDGRYRGVAPGARLLNGKVLDDDGWGLDSDIVAGMEWAVDQGARIVNLSIGGDDTPELDPVEQAIETLTADSGALFVVAAGNYGPTDHTVDSPASAPSALAVGAVDRDDVVAEFSGRGPATDGLLKPDLTAPGGDITAARAAGTGGDEDDAASTDDATYTTFSGTSMATPHVAGAAAILAQQHPEAAAQQLRAILTASAEPTANLTAFAQGAGRLDVARAIEQPVTTSPASLDFGVHEYPHEADPVTQQLTYRNTGDEPLELELSVEAYGPENAEFDVADPTAYYPFSDPAPDGMFTVEPATVTVPAGGEASVAVAADTRMDAEYGLYGGTVTATDAEADVVVRTAVGVDREGPTHEVTFTVLDTEGEPTANAWVGIDGYDTDVFAFLEPDASGEVTARVPEGTYQITASLDPDNWDTQTALFRPTLTVTEDVEMVLDGRLAEPFDLSVPNEDASAEWGFYSFTTSHQEAWRGWSYIGWPPHQLHFAQLGPDLPDGDVLTSLTGGWSTADQDGAREWYHSAWASEDSLLAGLRASPAREEFAEIDTTIGHTALDQELAFWGGAVDKDGYFFVFPTDSAPPAHGTNYVYGDKIAWAFDVFQERPVGDGTYWTTVRSEPQIYTPGTTYSRTYNVGVFGPSLTPSLEGAVGAVRVGDQFWAHIPMFGDGGGNTGYSQHTEATSTLSIDGEEIFSTDDIFRDELHEPWAAHAVPPGAGRFELSTDVSRSTDISSVSNRVQATWTFDADAAPGNGEVQEFPLSVVRFSPGLSPTSTARAGRSMRVPFAIEGAAEDNVEDLTIAVSYDEGETWKPVKMIRQDRFLVKHPKEPGSVSFRVHLTDRDGNTLDQTIHRAYLTE